MLGMLALSACSWERAVVPTVQTGAASDVAAVKVLKMFVADRSSNSVTVYADSANGDVAPLFHIRGSRTRLNAPSSLAFDAAQQLYVLSATSFAVFAKNARGNATPALGVGGGLTQISNPQGLAVDPTGKTYITNSVGAGSYITAYAAGSNGDRAPVQQIYDGQSFFFIPTGIALHGSVLYVADVGDQTINEYPASSNGIVNPTAVITGLNNPQDVTVDTHGRIYVTDSDSIVVYAANANGPAMPIRKISGSLTLMNGVTGVTVHNSEIAVANTGNDSITVYPENGNGNIAPLRQIVGPTTELSGPQGVAVR